MMLRSRRFERNLDGEEGRGTRRKDIGQNEQSRVGQKEINSRDQKSIRHVRLPDTHDSPYGG